MYLYLVDTVFVFDGYCICIWRIRIGKLSLVCTIPTPPTISRHHHFEPLHTSLALRYQVFLTDYVTHIEYVKVMKANQLTADISSYTVVHSKHHLLEAVGVGILEN